MMSVVLDQFLERARAEGVEAAFAARQREVHAYFAPSDEPLSYDSSGVMRLDVAIHAVHLAAARVALRSLPGIFRGKMDALKRSLAEFLAAKALGMVLFALLKRVLAVATFAFEIFQREKLEKELEQAIRRGVLRTMREVPAMKMKAKGKRIRRVKRVASRNPK